MTTLQCPAGYVCTIKPDTSLLDTIGVLLFILIVAVGLGLLVWFMEKHA